MKDEVWGREIKLGGVVSTDDVSGWTSEIIHPFLSVCVCVCLYGCMVYYHLCEDISTWCGLSDWSSYPV